VNYFRKRVLINFGDISEDIGIIRGYNILLGIIVLYEKTERTKDKRAQGK
jgi:hypothetical protein